MPRQPARLPALHRHHVDIEVPVVLAREGDLPAVGREVREVFRAEVARQAAAGAPAIGGDPQVGLGGEDDPIAVDVGIADVGLSGRDLGDRGQDDERTGERRSQAMVTHARTPSLLCGSSPRSSDPLPWGGDDLPFVPVDYVTRIVFAGELLFM